MLLFFGMQLIPMTYGILYLVHSFRMRRRGQALATLALRILAGVVTAVKYGKCTITASTDGGIQTAECELQTLFWDVADPGQYYFKHVY